jgi:hypothetical protein
METPRPLCSATQMQMGPCLAMMSDGVTDGSRRLGSADGVAEATLVGKAETDGSLLGKDDGLLTDGSRMLGPADGEAEANLLGDPEADGSLLVGKDDGLTDGS